MMITNNVTMDLMLPGYPAVMYAVQEDRYIRQLRIELNRHHCLHCGSAGQKYYCRWSVRARDGKCLTSRCCQRSPKDPGCFRRYILGSYPLLDPGGI